MTSPLLLSLLLSLLPSAVQNDMLVSTAWLAQNLSDPGLVILHVSKDGGKTYREGHIPGARLLLWGDFVTTRNGIPNELPSTSSLEQTFRRLGVHQGDRIVLYDEVGGIPAARAYFTLDSVGLGERACLLDGHLPKWKSEGRELSQTAVTPKPSTIELQANPATFVTKEEVLKLVTHKGGKNIPLVDCRKPAQFSGEKGAGHIPGATNVFVGDLLTHDDIPVLRPIRELLDLFEANKIPPKKEVITYCNTGQSASESYFILKYLGYKPKLYDGSMSEWSADPKAPVETGNGK